MSQVAVFMSLMVVTLHFLDGVMLGGLKIPIDNKSPQRTCETPKAPEVAFGFSKFEAPGQVTFCRVMIEAGSFIKGGFGFNNRSYERRLTGVKLWWGKSMAFIKKGTAFRP